MEKNPIEDFIKRLSFFKEFSESEREKLVSTSGIFEKFKMDEIIISEGELSAAVFVILTGTIDIKKKPRRTLKKIISPCKSQQPSPLQN